MAESLPRAAIEAPIPAPEPEDEQDLKKFGELINSAGADIRPIAGKWRTGLAGLVTLATTALLVKGPESTAKLALPARYVVVGLLAAGLLAAIVGLGLALAAEAGVPANVKYPKIRAKYGSIDGYLRAKGRTAVLQLAWSRYLVSLSLIAFLVGLVVWWLAPAATPSIKIATADTTVCGELKSADNREFRVAVKGESAPRNIPFDQATNVSVVAECQ